jgi:uracil-DNA glycosylase
MSNEVLPPEFREAMEEVRDLVRYAAALGIREIPRAPAAPSKAAGRAKHAAPAKRPSAQTKAASLAALREEIGDCMRCRLQKGRTHLVFGVGNPDARLMFIGEGPGRDEDLQGIPFVGRAGQLLTKIIEAMGLTRDDVYIANIVKCRPPENRAPAPDEVATCMPFLLRQIEVIAPDVIVCLGSVAAQNLLGTERKITTLRGHFQDFHGIPVMPTYHPAFLLRNPNMKKPVWEDMKQVMRLLKEDA